MNCDFVSLEKPTNSDVREFRDWLGNGPRSLSSRFRELLEWLLDDRLSVLEFPGLSLFIESLEYLLDGDDPNDVLTAALNVWDFGDEICAWIDELRRDCFGEWGNRFIVSFCELSDSQTIERFSRQFADPGDFWKDSTQQYAPGLTTFWIEMATFGVRELGTDAACELGNNRTFHLLVALARGQNEAHSLEDLAEAIGSDRIYAPSVKNLKHRLCRDLNSHRLTRLAEAITSQRGHYCLRADDHRIRVRVMELDETEM